MPGLGRVVPPARHHRDHREEHRLVERQPPAEPGADLGDVAVARTRHVGAELEVARVLGRLAADDPRPGGADRPAVVVAGGVPVHVLPHRGGEGVVGRHVLPDPLHVVAAERLEVGAEEPGAGHVLLGLAVQARMDRVVGPLEQPELAVLRQLEARVPVVLAGEADQPPRGHHDRGGDVVLHLHLVGGDEVLPQLVGAPGAVARRARSGDSWRPACGPRT